MRTVMVVGTVLVLAGCGGQKVQLGGDVDASARDGTAKVPRTDARSDSRPADARDAGSKHHDAGGKSEPLHQEAGGYVDAGYFHGDGAFFVDGGAYPDVGAPRDASGHGGVDAAFDASGIDASSGCPALSACCSSLPSSSQSLCTATEAAGNAANCTTELTQLQSTGECMGVSIIASEIQQPATQLLSDGTTLFWTDTYNSTGLFAVPVGGGAIKTLVAGGVQLGLVAVDDVNVYVTENPGLLRLPKNGSAPSLVSEAGAHILAVTTLGTSAYWMELAGRGQHGQPIVVKSAPLLGGSVATVALATITGYCNEPALGVTSSTAFVSYFDSIQYFPMTDAPSAPVKSVAGTYCESLTSDVDAVYCDVWNSSNLRIASDGTTAALGPNVMGDGSSGSPYIVFDDTYVYWADETTVGTIMKAPKAGGGTPTIIARDTSPTAIAVDDRSVYWSDIGGYIKSIPK